MVDFYSKHNANPHRGVHQCIRFRGDSLHEGGDRVAEPR
jgi:hypothetical protein